MQILQLQIQNFLSYENAKLDLADRGLVLVEGENRDQGGSNGAGKSSLFEAICWGLFGKTVSGLRGDDICRDGHKNTSVALTLMVDHFAVYVERFRKHHEFQNQLHLVIDSDDSRGATDKETQAKLCQILKLDWETFVSVIMFPQSQAGIAAWSDAESKGVLDTLLDLQRFQDARANLMRLLKADQARLAKLSTDLEVADASLQTVQGHLETLTTEHAAWKEAQEKRIEAAHEALLEKKGEEPATQLQTLTESLEASRRALAEARQEDVLNMVAQIEHRMGLLQDAQTMERARYQTLTDQAVRWKGEIVDPETELAKHQDCPSCGQLLPDEAREHLYSTFSEQAFEAREREKEAREQMLKISGGLAKQDAEMAKLRDLLMQTQDKLRDTSDLVKEVQEAERQVAHHHQIVSDWQNEVARLDGALAQEHSRASPFLSAMEKAEQQKLVSRMKKETVEKELIPLKEDVRYQEFWQDGFGNGGVKSLLMSTVTPVLNERANVYMSELTQGKARITIKTQKQLKSGEFRDKLDFQVEYPQGGSHYMGKSGGEKRRADLAILFAFGDLAANRARAPIALRLLDEPFESLDEVGCEQVVSLLKKHLVPRAKTVFVMTHNEALKALFENRVKVVKENGISRIV